MKTHQVSQFEVVLNLISIQWLKILVKIYIWPFLKIHRIKAVAFDVHASSRIVGKTRHQINYFYPQYGHIFTICSINTSQSNSYCLTRTHVRVCGDRLPISPYPVHRRYCVSYRMGLLCPFYKIWPFADTNVGTSGSVASMIHI